MPKKRFFAALWALTKPYWVSEKRGTTPCIRTLPSSPSGTLTIAWRAANCGSAKTSAMS